MRITQIRDLLAVVDAGSLRAAARSVGVSQPAITKSIRQLEAELRVQLLQRSARGAVATAAGKAFLARARVAQVELRKAVEDLAPYQGDTDASVAIGVSPNAAALLLPDALQRFRRRHPAARLRVVEGVGTALLPAVRDATLDFAVAGSARPSAEPGLRFKALMRLSLVVAARQGHPLGRATSLRELASSEWLVFYPAGSGAVIEKAFAAAGLAMPRTVVQCESCAGALALLGMTDILALISPRVVQSGLGQYRLQQIKVREPIPAPLLGIYHRDAPFTAAGATLSQALMASARRLR